ncbi:hypothetical protein [Chryseobacterium oncorhynchi]|uniref:Uncharacterized protein n=1 Tax=Chryseobacterium oncorhynchi TaxID=741074 RepID=A0A316X212_9FLAO|nr:hypothetical protein [Chryseobacterium oncorhynchi]PWN67597.1 hypothetical protein C1638_003125 [Chryseobacterium oncorhynchi]
MSTKALEFLTTDWESPQEEFNTGLVVFINHGGGRHLSRSYNTKGFTPQNLENLKYDLKKLLNIKDQDIRNFKLEKEKVPELPPHDLEIVLAENKDAFTKFLDEIEKDAKGGLKLYAQYPFLRSKECPNEFKILVSDAITAFDSYKAAHEELFTKVASVVEPQLTEVEIFNIANELLEDFQLNREIHEELKHYAENSEILGEHEIFADLKLDRSISAMTPAELSNRFNNLKSYVSRTKGKITKNKDPQKTEELKKELAGYEKEKDLVHKKLNEKE